jgi:DNA-binding IclR family transcriptional regulator
VGANTALVRTPYQQRILDVLQNAPEGATPTWIAQQISGDKNERSHVFRALQSMQKQGLVGCVQTRWFTVEQLVAHERGKRARR